MQNQNEEWITMAVAAQLFGVSAAKISRMATNSEIQTRDNPKDKRVRLVNVNELTQYFGEDPKISQEQ